MSAVMKLPHVRYIAAATLMLAGTALAPRSVAHATPLQDKQGTWTLQGENDAVSTLKGTSDQYYTSGLRLNWTSGTDTLPTPIAAINKAIWGNGVQRISMGLQQMIFTPRDTQSSSPWGLASSSQACCVTGLTPAFCWEPST